MSLNAELHAFFTNRYPQIPAAARAVMERAGRELAESGWAAGAPGPSTPAPDFTLPAADGRKVTLSSLLAEGPVVLTFYRGAWCPYCNLTLRSLQEHHAAITARGARLVAVSPQVPDESLTLAQKHELAFDVLSDVGSEVAERYGIAFDLPEDLAAVYDSFGFEMQRVNGGHPRTLPLPATFVIDRTGTVRWTFADPDYVKRAEPADILAALDALPAA
ncbi:peroxiredoxin-like family protein [Streptomyces rimosus]|uniref:peroxiredoxin-like family protein n=1 Tax=Streptomyces rimosus TaxID=1927 RepID=UPI000517E66A|nr:peroxiredoxin-like family protein [Streptomyces rimosus]